jgi:hypothetical protein
MICQVSAIRTFSWHFIESKHMNRIHHKAEKDYSLFIDGFTVLARELQLFNRV